MAVSLKRSTRILAGVREDIDRFLNPEVFALADREAFGLGASALAAAAPSRSEVAGAEAVAAAEINELKLETSRLKDDVAGLQSELENAREEADAQRRLAERQSGREAGAVARLEQRCEQLEIEVRSVQKRACVAESNSLQAQAERDALCRERDELSQVLALREENFAQDSEEERRRFEKQLAVARVAAAAAASDVGGSGGFGGEDGGVGSSISSFGPADAKVGEVEALRSRVAELESELSSLRLALAESGPDRALAARLRQQHREYEQELRSARAAQQELKHAKAEMMRLEREQASMRAALEARDAALREAEDTARHSASAVHDLQAFQQAAMAAVAEARSVATANSGRALGVEAVSEQSSLAAAVTPLDLSLAWARLQSEVGALRQRQAELQQELERSVQQERKTQVELSQAKSEVASGQARAEDLQLDLRRARDDATAQRARASVLREAMGRANCGEVSADKYTAAEVGALTSQLEAAQRQASNFKTLAQARQKAAEERDRELQAARAENLRLVDAEAKAAKLERLNTELWGANRELEQQHERLAAELEERDAQAEDFDRETTNILHLVQGADGQLATGRSSSHVALTSGSSTTAQQQTLAALRAENTALREGLQRGLMPTRVVAAAGDLERKQVEKQLDRFKQATRKYVQDFREGIYGLLGWKVEMKGEGSAMRWHLSSRYLRDGQELVFQLRPPAAGRAAEFDLLSTEWAERIQEDRQAMAYLEVYGSIPGFLACITTDLLSRGSLQS